VRVGDFQLAPDRRRITIGSPEPVDLDPTVDHARERAPGKVIGGPLANRRRAVSREPVGDEPGDTMNPAKHKLGHLGALVTPAVRRVDDQVGAREKCRPASQHPRLGAMRVDDQGGARVLLLHLAQTAPDLD
jgi:hypothetical protein